MKKLMRAPATLDHLDDLSLTFYRVIGKILVDSPKPTIADEQRGDMIFSIPLKSIGIGAGDLPSLRKVLVSRFHCDVVAELIMRRNLSQFIDHIAGDKGYEHKVRLAKHYHFGVSLNEQRAYFYFHVSKLAELINEEIQKILQ